MKKKARPLIHEFKKSEKYIALSDLIYYTWKNIKNSYKNNKVKISGLTWHKN